MTSSYIEECRPLGTLALAGATRCHIPEGGSLHSHRCENLKPYKKLHSFKYLHTIKILMASTWNVKKIFGISLPERR
jgi:hypothetical protein